MEVDFNWSRILPFITGFVALLVGWAIGFWDSNNRTAKKISMAEEKAELAIKQSQSEAERAAMTAQAARAAAESVKPALPGTSLLRLWLDSNQNPQLDLDSQRVETSPLSDSNRKRLLALLNLFRPWIESKSASTSPVSSPAPMPASPPTPRPVMSPAPASAPLAPALPAAAVKDEKPAAPLSIVGQINEILQARLASSLLANRGIRLQESPEGGAIVWVGLQKFSSVGEVTDPEVQAIIRAAIAEWEKKYTPG